MKNNKWIIGVIATLVVLMVALGILVVVLLCSDDDEKVGDDKVEKQTTISAGDEKKTTDDGQETGEKKTMGENGTTGENKTAGESETTGENETTDSKMTIGNSGNTEGIYIVVDGYEIFVPSAYYCFYNDQAGCIVEFDDVFQMIFKVKDMPYTEIVANRESLTDKSIAAGATVVQDVKEVKVDGKDYIYFSVDLNGEKIYLIYTQVGSTNSTIGTQFVAQSDKLTDEDILKVFASMATSAKKTDKPNSTLDDIVVQQAENMEPDGAKTESTLEFGDDSVTYKVPEGFYSSACGTWEYFGYEYFFDENYDISVSCYLRDTEDYENAQSYIQSKARWENTLGNDMKVQSATVDGAVCYYIISSYTDTDDGVHYQKIYAAYNNSETSIYIVEVVATDLDYELTFDMFEEFFMISK